VREILITFIIIIINFSSAPVSHRPETGSCISLLLCKLICIAHLNVGGY
jgi:hypothetical protein